MAAVPASRRAARSSPWPAAAAIRRAISPHGGWVLQPALAGVEVAAVDGAQQAGGVQDVGETVLAGIGIADGVGQHGRNALLVGEGAGGHAQ